MDKKEWKNLFLKSLSLLPDKEITVSLSGGIDSSIIVYGLLELDRKPDYCITFKVGDKESNDLYYSRKICERYNIKQIITQIPLLNKEQLESKCVEIIEQTGVARSIDVLICFAYSYMLKEMKTKNIVLGLYEYSNYLTTAKTSINYNRYKKGTITYEEYHDNYVNWRRNIHTNEKTNHVVIIKYITDKGFNVYTPLKNEELVNYSLNFDYHDFHILNGKTYYKYPLIDMFSSYFDEIGNHLNRKQGHIECGMKQYHIDTLLPDSGYKNLNGVYNKLKRGLKSERNLEMFFRS